MLVVAKQNRPQRKEMDVLALLWARDQAWRAGALGAHMAKVVVGPPRDSPARLEGGLVPGTATSLITAILVSGAGCLPAALLLFVAISVSLSSSVCPSRCLAVSLSRLRPFRLLHLVR